MPTSAGRLVSISSTSRWDYCVARVAKAAGQILRRGGSIVVFCDNCKTARMDGPEYCPTCGGPLRAVADVVEGKKSKPGEAFTPAEPVELDLGGEKPEVVGKSFEKPSARKPCPNPVGLWAEVRESGKLTYNGKSQTLEQWAKETGLSIKTIKNRITRRFTVDRVLYVPSLGGAPIEKRLQGDTHTFTFQGETLSLVEWSRKLGIQYATLYDRINRGWPVERAFTEPLEEETVLEFQGRRQTINEWSDEIGVTPAAIRKRMRKGFSIERVLAAGEGDAEPSKRLWGTGTIRERGGGFEVTIRSHGVRKTATFATRELAQVALDAAVERKDVAKANGLVAAVVRSQPITEATPVNQTLQPYIDAASKLREDGVLAPVSVIDPPEMNILESVRQWREQGLELRARLQKECDALLDRADELGKAMNAIDTALEHGK